MAEPPDPLPSSVPSGLVDEIVATLARAGPDGASAARVAQALGLGHDPDLVQEALEELVARGVLARRGIGRGALYTRGTGL